MNRLRLLAAATVLAMSPTAVLAVPIFSTLPDYTGPADFDGTSLPSSETTIGTFSFTVPDGDEVVSASVSGTWGNGDFPSTAGTDVFLDGIMVAQCIEFADCWKNATGILPWSFTLAGDQLDLLDDGMAELTVIQTSTIGVVLGSLTMELETAAVHTPEPTTLALLGLGLAVWGFARRRQR